MVSAFTIMKLFANALIQMWDHDPDSAAASVVTPDGGTTQQWEDLRDYGGFAVLAMPTNLTGNGITQVEIVAATDVLGTNLQVIVDSGVVAADAVGDYVALECSAEQVREVGEATGFDLRYAAARITMENAADEAAVTYIRHMPRFAQDGLTATTIS